MEQNCHLVLRLEQQRILRILLAFQHEHNYMNSELGCTISVFTHKTFLSYFHSHINLWFLKRIKQDYRYIPLQMHTF